MKYWIIVGMGIVAFGAVFILLSLDQKKFKPSLIRNDPSLAMHIESSAFSHNGSLPPDYTCDGKGANPPLLWSGVPSAAQSLVLFFDDPDAPRETFDHWVVWNIDPSLTAIAEGETPSGVVGKNSGGGNAYYPPCPPSGEHRYVFKLFVLDTLLSLPAGSKKADVKYAMDGHVLDSAELLGRYTRK